jgi:hypothetical protein
MFSLVFQRPSRPHQFFKDGTDVSLIAPHVGSENPPAYVSVVTYGRMFYLLIRSSESSTTMEATLQANFDLGLFGAELGSSVNYLTSFRNLNMQFYSYGGSSAELPNAIGGGLESLKSFKQALKNGNNFKLAKPVFATIRSVASDELVRNGYNLGFTYRECQSGGKLCSPALLSPQPSATLDNGCTTTSNSIKWAFSWTACENAEEYQIRVTNTTLGTVVDVDGIKVTTYSKSFTSPFTVRTGWKWMVRSKVGGNWGPWSRTSGFSLEPVGTDCPSPRIVLYEHANYGGASITLNKDTPNLDIDALNFADVASSVKLYYIDRVRLYDGANYTGTYIEVAANDTYVGDAFSDRAGSVDFQPFR